MDKYSDKWFSNYKKHRMLSKVTLEGNISISYYDQDQNKFHPVDVGEAHYIDLSDFCTEYLIEYKDVSIKDLHKYCKYLIEYYNLAKNKWIKFDIAVYKLDAFFDKRKYFCNKVFYYFNKEV